MKTSKPTILTLKETKKRTAKRNESILLFVTDAQVLRALEDVKVQRGTPPQGPGLDLVPIPNGDYIGFPVCGPDERLVLINGRWRCVSNEFGDDMPDDQTPVGCYWDSSPLTHILTCRGTCEGGSRCRRGWFFSANGFSIRCYCAVLRRGQVLRTVPRQTKKSQRLKK